MPSTAPRLAAAAFLLLCTALASVAATPADAASKACKPRAGTVFRDAKTRIFHERRALFACTTLTASGRPRTVRMGPWTAGGRAVSDGSYVAWTTKRTLDGTRVDRVWAGSVDGRRFLSGARAIPAAGPVAAQEGRVQRLLVTTYGAAWVTTTSDVVLAIGGLPTLDPQPIETLPAVPQPSGRTLLVGSWPATPAATLAATAELRHDFGETDDCGGSMWHDLTVDPDGDGTRLGVRWDGTAPIDPQICGV
jgi:hypothetical protein